MVTPILENELYENLYNFIKEKGIVTQPEIIKEFTKRLNYDKSKKTLNRMKIGNKLLRLERFGLIEKKPIQGKGVIPTNKWRVVPDDKGREEKFSELSVKLS